MDKILAATFLLKSRLWILSRKMPWQICPVFLFSCGSLLWLAVGESPVYKSGVQHDVPISSLVAAGCVPCYEAPYGSVSKSQDITSCTGPYLFVGTEIGDKQVLEIGALTSVEVLRMESTRSEPYLSNGLYWHYMKGCSFGFKAVECDDNSIDGERRDSVVTKSSSRAVSWSIDQSIGCTTDDELETHSAVVTSSWTKHAYNCPGVRLHVCVMMIICGLTISCC